MIMVIITIMLLRMILYIIIKLINTLESVHFKIYCDESLIT